MPQSHYVHTVRSLTRSRPDCHFDSPSDNPADPLTDEVTAPIDLTQLTMVCELDTLIGLQDLHIRFERQWMTIRPDQYLIDRTVALMSVAPILTKSASQDEQPARVHYFILGDTFLRSVYTVFDAQAKPPRLGFAVAVRRARKPTRSRCFND